MTYNLKRGHEIEWNGEYPSCDFCDHPGIYDGKTVSGYWANMCQGHFDEIGVGTGAEDISGRTKLSM